MNQPDDKKQHDPHLRATAEAQLEHVPMAEPLARPAEELLHELQVHQIELEMQNETLRQKQIALEEARNRYVDLYEFAPVGYLTLNSDGMIAEINLTGTTLLGAERKNLLHRQFASLVIPEDQARWTQLFLSAKSGNGKDSAELTLHHGDGTVFYAQLDCMRPAGRDSLASGQSAPGVRIALSDITERKLAESKLAEQIEELQRWHAATLGRELRSIELKREVNQLLGQAGQPPRYPSAEADETGG